MCAKIIIGADIVPTSSNMQMFENGSMDEIVDKDLINLLASANYRIFNLEVPLTDYEKPIDKCGPNLIAPIKCANGLKDLNINFVTLSNNHIMDQGDQGLQSTIKALDSVGISHGGAAEDIHEAEKPFIINIDGIRIGIYSCAEHEFSIASDNHPGANPFDAFESLDQISNLKDKVDYIIVLYHGGKELYQYPSPELQKRCRKMIDKGANLIICQHSHCIGCKETWRKGTIIYGQGNFLFDNSTNELWKTGLLIELTLSTNHEEIRYFPIVKKDNGVSLAINQQAAEILSGFEERSKQIMEDGFVYSSYAEYANKQIVEYMASNEFFLKNFLIRILDKISNHQFRKYYAKKKVDKMKELLLNQYECEAHRELIIQGLKDAK